MVDVVEAHCPYCKKVTNCELTVTGCLSAILKCQDCQNIWRETTDYC